MTQKENLLQRITNFFENILLNLCNSIGLNKFVVWYKKHQEGVRYLIFGALSTVINIITFMMLKQFGLSTLISNFIAWIISIIFGYFTNKMCVFYSKSNNKKELIKEFVSFVIYRILTLGIDELYMYITIDIFKFNSLMMKTISNIIVILLNFIFSKLFVFKECNDKL